MFNIVYISIIIIIIMLSSCYHHPSIILSSSDHQTIIIHSSSYHHPIIILSSSLTVPEYLYYRTHKKYFKSQSWKLKLVWGGNQQPMENCYGALVEPGLEIPLPWNMGNKGLNVDTDSAPQWRWQSPTNSVGDMSSWMLFKNSRSYPSTSYLYD